MVRVTGIIIKGTKKAVGIKAWKTNVVPLMVTSGSMGARSTVARATRVTRAVMSTVAVAARAAAVQNLSLRPPEISRLERTFNCMWRTIIPGMKKRMFPPGPV